MKSLVNTIFPNSKVQSTIPKGDKLLPVADLTWNLTINEFYLSVTFNNMLHSYNF